MITVIVVLIFICSIDFLELIMTKMKLRSLNQQLDLWLREGRTVPIHLKSTSNCLNQIVNSINSILETFQTHLSEEKKKTLKNQQMITTLSYDLQKPLVSMREALDYLGRAELTKEDRDVVQKLWQSSVDSAGLINNYIEYNYVIDVLPELKICKIELTSILEDEIILSNIAAEGKELDYDRPEKEIFIRGDRAILRKMIHNLLLNSLVHTTGVLHLFIQEDEYVEMHFISILLLLIS